MRALGQCGPHSLGFRRILYTAPRANRRLGPALSGPAPSCSTEAPCILYQNGLAAVTVTTAHRHHFSASRHNGKYLKGKWVRPPWEPPSRYIWVSPIVADYLYRDVCDFLQSQILDSSRRATEGFPVTPVTPDPNARKGIPKTLNPYNPENQTPPDPPDPDDPQPRDTYDALAIDCEMVVVKGREQDLLRIAVVDFFTGHIVLRGLVRPTGIVTDWRREVTGYTKAKLKEAIKKGKVLAGWEAVREKLFEVTTRKTIFIGHGLSSDLRVLRIATDRVVDSMTMMSRAVFGDPKNFPRNWGLKTACQELLRVEVQKTRGPHDPLEDAFASRELVLQCALDPEKLAEWGARTRANLDKIVQKEKAKEEAKIEKKKRRKAEREKMSPEQLAQEKAERVRKAAERQMAKAAERQAKIDRRNLKRAEKRERRKKSQHPWKMGGRGSSGESGSTNIPVEPETDTPDK